MENEKLDEEFQKIDMILTYEGDENKLKALHILNEEFAKSIIISNLKSEEKKLELLSKLSNDKEKLRVISSMQKDANKLHALPELTEESSKVFVITSIDDDDKKLELVSEFETDVSKTSILRSIKDDGKKLGALSNLDSEFSKFWLILSMQEDKNKLFAIQELNDEYKKLQILCEIREEILKEQILAETISNQDMEEIKKVQIIKKLIPSKSLEKKYSSFDLPSEMTIGIEIEAEGEYAKLIFDYGGYKNWEKKQDETLDSNKGIEIVSPILHDNDGDINQIYEITTAMQELEFRATENCGGHVHIGASYLKSVEELKELLEIYGNTEKIFYYISNKPGELPRSRIEECATPISSEIENININESAEDVQIFRK